MKPIHSIAAGCFAALTLFAPLTPGFAEEPLPSPAENGPFLRLAFDAEPSAGEFGLRVRALGATPHAPVVLEWGPRDGEALTRVTSVALVADDRGEASMVIDSRVPPGTGIRARSRGRIATAWGPCSSALNTSLSSVPQNLNARSFVPQRGNVVVTEFMKDPTFVTDAHGEWIELENIGSLPVNLAGWRIADGGSNSHTILNGVQSILIMPGQRFVLGNDANPLTNGGVHVDYQYSGFTLANGADSIQLYARMGALVDQVDYDDGILWPDVPGASVSLQPTIVHAVSNDDGANWCPGQTPLSLVNVDLGTPFHLNDNCP